MGDVSQLVALVNGSFDEHFPMLMSMLEPVTVMIRDLGVSSAATADKLALIAASTLFWTLLHIACKLIRDFMSVTELAYPGIHSLIGRISSLWAVCQCIHFATTRFLPAITRMRTCMSGTNGQ